MKTPKKSAEPAAKKRKGGALIRVRYLHDDMLVWAVAGPEDLPPMPPKPKAKHKVTKRKAVTR